MNQNHQLSVHIDGAFLLKQLERISGQNRIDPIAFRSSLLSYIQGRWQMRMLRAYWYSSPGINGDNGYLNEAISFLDNFKVRLGSVGYVDTVDGGGLRQKGVDGLLIVDMIQLAQNRSVTDMLLIAGDADFVPAVELVQSLGVHVHLVCPEDINGSLARNLKSEVDTLVYWKRPFIETFFTENSKVESARIISLPEKSPSEQEAVSPPLDEEDLFIRSVAAEFCSALNAEEVDSICGENIPPALDRDLLFIASRHAGRSDLPSHIKKSIRREARRIARGVRPLGKAVGSF